MKRFAGVFNLTYKRFLDIQNAEEQAKESEAQKRLIEEKHREITDNISYALRIQSAILPSEKLVKDFLRDSFVLYLPKDVVAGRFLLDGPCKRCHLVFCLRLHRSWRFGCHGFCYLSQCIKQGRQGI